MNEIAKTKKSLIFGKFSRWAQEDGLDFQNPKF